MNKSLNLNNLLNDPTPMFTQQALHQSWTDRNKANSQEDLTPGLKLQLIPLIEDPTTMTDHHHEEETSTNDPQAVDLGILDQMTEEDLALAIGNPTSAAFCAITLDTATGSAGLTRSNSKLTSNNSRPTLSAIDVEENTKDSVTLESKDDFRTKKDLNNNKIKPIINITR